MTGKSGKNSSLAPISEMRHQLVMLFVRHIPLLSILQRTIQVKVNVPPLLRELSILMEILKDAGRLAPLNTIIVYNLNTY